MQKQYLIALLASPTLYLLHQLLFLSRFGRLNPQLTLTDLGLFIVSAIAVWFFVRTLTQLSSTRSRTALSTAFVISLLLSVITSLAGGLLGIIGVIIFGLLPFGIILVPTTWILRKRGKEA